MSCIAKATIGERSHVILILGSGLIGSAIAGELSIRFSTVIHPIFIDWGKEKTNLLQNVYRQFAQVISKSIENCAVEPKVHVIWAAGSSNFSSDNVETKYELSIFSSCIKETSNLVITQLSEPVSFHLASSIGGLFEGQYCVSLNSTPNPIRPYGHLKLSEENLLSCHNDTIFGYVYRLSSVYGFVRPLQRKGLISTLIENAMMGRVTVISGSMCTLRDFVWAPDVARFIVRRIEEKQPSVEPVLLASGKSETVENVKRLVEASLRRKVFSRYLYSPTNDASICVSKSELPDVWIPSYVISNIRRIVASYRYHR